MGIRAATPGPVHAMLLLGLVAGCASVETADLVITGGRIVTVDAEQPEAEALAVVGDRIVAVGNAERIRRHVGPETLVVDLEGRLAIPGLIDSHAHFLGIGRAQTRLQLQGTGSWAEVIAMVAEAVEEAAPGEWILGRGWHQEKWSSAPVPNVDGLPMHQTLSAISPDNPVLLTHASGHSCFANALAMEQAGVTAQTPDPEGGEIVRDDYGEPIGVFRETAQGLVGRGANSDEGRTPEQLLAERRKLARLAADECLAKGITSLHDAGVGFDTVDFYRSLAEQGELGVRLHVMLSEGNARLEQRIDDYRLIGLGDHFLTVRAIKRLIDSVSRARRTTMRLWRSVPTGQTGRPSGITAAGRSAKARGCCKATTSRRSPTTRLR